MANSPTQWPIIGHQVAVDVLARAARTGRVGHAYLFAGPSGIGRATLARTFAQALVCKAPMEQRPCGDCSSCRRVQRGIYPDVSVVSLESQGTGGKADAKNTRISIETIRDLRGSISLRPLEGDWRVAIIEDVDLLSRDAFDALLKTLEEPPPFVVLILIATEIEAVPETIRSRCRPVMLEPLSRADVAASLTERGVEPAKAMMIASITRGRIGHALALAENDQALAARQETIDAGLDMIENPLVAIGGARRMAEAYRRGQRHYVEQQIDALLGLWRDLLLVASGCPEHVVNADVRDRLASLAERWGPEQVHQGVKATYQALTDLAANAQPRLILDHMVTQWPQTR